MHGPSCCCLNTVICFLWPSGNNAIKVFSLWAFWAAVFSFLLSPAHCFLSWKSDCSFLLRAQHFLMPAHKWDSTQTDFSNDNIPACLSEALFLGVWWAQGKIVCFLLTIDSSLVQNILTTVSPPSTLCLRGEDILRVSRIPVFGFWPFCPCTNPWGYSSYSFPPIHCMCSLGHTQGCFVSISVLVSFFRSQLARHSV